MQNIAENLGLPTAASTDVQTDGKLTGRLQLPPSDSQKLVKPFPKCYNLLMKIIHCADLHLDSRLTGLNHNKAITRRQELVDTFRNLTVQAGENKIDAVVIAGDLFDDRYASARTKNEVADIFASAKDVEFYLLAGNHDSGTFDDAFAKRLPSNVHIFGKNGVTRFDLEDVSFFGAEGESLSVASLKNIEMDPSRFNVLVTHADIASKSAYGGLDLKLLADKPVDYVALGHIHRPYLTKAGRGHAAYSGCLECRGFDEPGEHGFYLIKTHLKADDPNRIVFVPFTSRVCYEIDLDVSDADSRTALLKKAEDALCGVRPEDLVSVTLSGEAAEGLDAETALRPFLESRFFAVRLKNKTRLKIDAAKYADDVSLKAEFVRKACKAGLDDDALRDVLSYGFNALTNEEIDLL